MSTVTHPEIETKHDFLPLNGTDHVEFYVGNARQAAYYYRTAFGMSLVAYAGPETGQRDRASYVVEQGKIRFVLTTPFAPTAKSQSTFIATATAFTTSRSGWTTPSQHGAKQRNVALAAFLSPQKLQRRTRRWFDMATIATYGDTVHTFVERRNYTGRLSSRVIAPSRAITIARPTGLLLHRPHGGQRRLARDESLGRLLSDVDGLRALPALRRQGHLHRILGADVEGDGATATAASSSPSTSRPRAAENRRSKSTSSSTTAPACSTSPWRPTTSWTRWPLLKQQGVEFLTVPHTYYEELHASCRQDGRADRASWRDSASWSIAMKKATCCRSSRGPSKTGRRCSSRSSSEKAAAASARETSRRSLRPSSGSRQRVETCKVAA